MFVTLERLLNFNRKRNWHKNGNILNIIYILITIFR